jgi:hypothetical protein
MRRILVSGGFDEKPAAILVRVEAEGVAESVNHFGAPK